MTSLPLYVVRFDTRVIPGDCLRNRLEDLGRLAVMIDLVLDHPLFVEERVRAKELNCWFEKLSLLEQSEYIYKIGYAIEHIENALADIREIARGEDKLNEEKHEKI